MARLLKRDGQLEEVLALLRCSPHHLVHLDLAGMLIQHVRPAEALSALPTTAEARAAAEHRRRRRSKQDDSWADTSKFAQEPPL
ncbi:hypothetical protein [Streptomyces fagopyri]|uniref:hypothetical protein n=1 Tax=Streptomyces fagopyri TaxID=2662397 RepID=UPI00341004C1